MSVYNTKEEEMVVVCGQRFIVSEATTMTGSKRYILMTEAAEQMKSIDFHGSETEEKILLYMATMVYPAMISVTKSIDAPLPTIQEFIEMPELEKERWLEVVKKKNPHFFPDEELTEEESKEKKN